MLKKQLFATMLALSFFVIAPGVRADLAAKTTGGDAQQEERDEQEDRRFLEQFRAAQLSLARAITIAERLHPGSRTIDINFDASDSPSFRARTVKGNVVWENVIDANNGSILGPETTSSLSELDGNDRKSIVALRSVTQELADAVQVAEKAAAGKAVGGILMQEGGKPNFVVFVVAGEHMKQVTLEPPKAGRLGSDDRRRIQP